MHPDVLGVSYIRVRGDKEEEIGDYKVYLTGVRKGRAESGVGHIIRNTIARNIVSVRHVNEQMMWVDLAIGGIRTRIVSVYSPCEGADEDEVDKFYEALSDIVVRVNTKDRIVLMGDFIARVGNRTEGYERVIVKCGEDTEAKGNGKRLLDFCASMCLAVMNTFFKHKAIHRYTWEARGIRPIIEYIYTNFEFTKSVRNLQVFRGFFDDTGHYLICSGLIFTQCLFVLDPMCYAIFNYFQCSKILSSFFLQQILPIFHFCPPQTRTMFVNALFIGANK
ncbi:craniofacial development protein 2-like [Anabrus simplex]|uniref:craniofacial development protein 2-like n=1 Tax=Anabrus simplex TaxID=316456 RepID=UPI0035A2C652